MEQCISHYMKPTKEYNLARKEAAKNLDMKRKWNDI